MTPGMVNGQWRINRREEERERERERERYAFSIIDWQSSNLVRRSDPAESSRGCYLLIKYERREYFVEALKVVFIGQSTKTAM
jgi:hypothetical protein